MSFINLKKGFVINQKYCIIKLIGKGTEGEVYLIEEIKTKIRRAAKIFYPAKNKNNKTLEFHAKKLHKLEKCSLLISYHTDGEFTYKHQKYSFLVSEFIDGIMLSQFIDEQPLKKLDPFKAFSLFHTLVCGLEEIHKLNEYHGDIHTDNIIIEKFGTEIQLKLIDIYNWNKDSKSQNKKDDLYNVLYTFYESLGGRKFYKYQPNYIKDICLGLHRPKIFKKYKNISELKKYIEQINLIKKRGNL